MKRKITKMLAVILLGLITCCGHHIKQKEPIKYRTLKIEHKWIGVENRTDYTYNVFSGRLSPVGKSVNMFMLMSTTGEDVSVSKKVYFSKEVGDTIRVVDRSRK